MFPVRAEHIRRVSFASKLFPRINSPSAADSNKFRTNATVDEDAIRSGGRSKNKDLLAFFGFIADSQRGASTFAQLPLFRRSIKKLIRLVENELEVIGAHEVLLPTIIPKKLWQQSGRLERQKDALNNVFSFQDHAGTDLLLGPTYEESITQLVRDSDPLKEQDLPLLLYQTSAKFRYESNPKFGLIRSNEFLMNDLYSFDSCINRAEKTYEKMNNVYSKIFARLSLECLKFESVTGGIGGRYSHEYQLPVSSGEDSVVRCKSCNYSYNDEMCRQSETLNSNVCLRCKSNDIERMQTLELAHTFLLSDIYSKPMNAKIRRDDGSKVNLEMGCFGLGLSRIVGAGLDYHSQILDRSGDRNHALIQMRWPSEIEPYKLGIISPAKRSKQYAGGSTNFVQNLVTRLMQTTRDIDVLVEDRDKDGISKRLEKIQSLGIPNIIVVGQRFLEEMPEFELFQLSKDKIGYDQVWLTEEQVVDFVRGLDNI